MLENEEELKGKASRCMRGDRCDCSTYLSESDPGTTFCEAVHATFKIRDQSLAAVVLIARCLAVFPPANTERVEVVLGFAVSSVLTDACLRISAGDCTLDQVDIPVAGLSSTSTTCGSATSSGT